MKPKGIKKTLERVNRIGFYEDLGEFLKNEKEMNFGCSYIA